MWKYITHLNIFLKTDAFLNNIQADICKGGDLRQNFDSDKLKYPGNERTCILF